MKIHSEVLKLFPVNTLVDQVTLTGAPLGCNVLMTY
jgi:hypothetical protein